MMHYGVTKAPQIAVVRGLANSLVSTGGSVNSAIQQATSPWRQSRTVRRLLGGGKDLISFSRWKVVLGKAG
jgi:hypothetical protein